MKHAKVTYTLERPQPYWEITADDGRWLNDAVTAAIEARRSWLDAKMHEVSRLQPGDDIYDVVKGVRLGTVRKLYRFQTGRNDLLDTSVSCNYEYETRPRGFDNTSRQIGVQFGTREDAAHHAEMRLQRLTVSKGETSCGF